MTIPLPRSGLDKLGKKTVACERAQAGSSLRGLHVLGLAARGPSLNPLWETLATAGAEVETTDSISDALERARGFRPDALVVEAEPARWPSVMHLARRIEEAFSGRLPVVICAPAAAHERWQTVDAALQIYVATPPEASTLLPLVGTVARLGCAPVTH
jgi:hypothetical protein